MAIPVITIPEQGKILSRPRFEPLYDTEGWDDGGAVDPVITIFQNSTAFANTALGLTKTYGRDVNLDAVSGLAIGQSFQFYGLSKKIRTMNQTVTAANASIIRDQIRQINSTSWFTFYFQQRQPFFTVQNWQVPFCVDETYYSTSAGTGAGISMEGPACLQSREERYDVTIGDAPVEFGQLESWTVDIGWQVPAANAITPTLDYYVQVVMKGIFLRGIQG